MQYKLISLLPLQLARIACLVRAIDIVELDDRSQHSWALLARGRGFTRILRDDPLPLPGVIRPLGWDKPRPMRFQSPAIARNYGESMGLLPCQKEWPVKIVR